LSILN